MSIEQSFPAQLPHKVAQTDRKMYIKDILKEFL